MSAADSAIVVGGGIVGLVAARALALNGVEVTLLEQRPEVTDEGGIGIGLQNNALNALDEIGVAGAIVEHGVPVDMLYVHAPDGSLIASRPGPRYCGSSWPGYTGISRAALHEVLVEAAREAGVDMLTSARLVRFEEAGKRVTATLADGRTLSADVLVGADGIHSTVRRQLFPEHPGPQPLNEGVWRTLIPGERRDEVRLMFGGGVGTVGYCPLADDLYLYVVDRLENLPARDEPDPAARLKERIGHLGGFPAELLPALSKEGSLVTFRPLQAIFLPAPWYSGRVILIGDAAHAGPPTLAQGAAMGIEDAVVLAKCLDDAATVDEALGRFMDRRYDRVRSIVDASVTLSRAQLEPDGEAKMAEANSRAAQVLSQPY